MFSKCVNPVYYLDQRLLFLNLACDDIPFYSYNFNHNKGHLHLILCKETKKIITFDMVFKCTVHVKC